MQPYRIKNAMRNIFFGFILKIYQFVFPFIIRTLMIYYIGMEYVGLGDVFISILQILNIVELGVGSALVFSMYKPVVEKDTYLLCALLKLYRFYYRIIGLIVLIMGLVCIPFLSKIIAGEVPKEYSIVILYLISLLTSVFSYWIFAYKSSIFQAHQRNDIISKIKFVVETFKYAFQIVSLVIFRNYYLFLLSILVGQIISNLFVEMIAKKNFPQYIPSGEITTEDKKTINRKVRHVFTAKLGGAIQNSSDSIVISAFLGLNMLAIYQNYYLIILMLIAFFNVFYQGTLAGIGNSLVTETKKKNYEDLEKFTYVIQALCGFCIVLLFNLYQPFMKVWVGSENMFSFSMVIFLCVYFYIAETNQLLILYKDAAGMWSEDRFRPLITGILNLLLNLILVRYIGIYGVVLSTIISITFLGLPWLIHNVFSVIFECSAKTYLLKILGYFVRILFTTLVVYSICSIINLKGILEIVVKFFISSLLGGSLLYLLLRKKEEYQYVKEIINLFIKHLKKR